MEKKRRGRRFLSLPNIRALVRLLITGHPLLFFVFKTISIIRDNKEVAKPRRAMFEAGLLI